MIYRLIVAAVIGLLLIWCLLVISYYIMKMLFEQNTFGMFFTGTAGMILFTYCVNIMGQLGKYIKNKK